MEASEAVLGVEASDAVVEEAAVGGQTAAPPAPPAPCPAALSAGGPRTAANAAVAWNVVHGARSAAADASGGRGAWRVAGAAGAALAAAAVIV